MIDLRRIVCPTDFSDFSRRALAQAAALARWYDAEITVLYVNPIAVVPAPEVGFLPQPEPLSPEQRERVLGDMRSFAEAERVKGAVVRVALAEGDAAAQVCAEAVRLDADLVVMGTHGRSGLDHLVLGSVTERVVRKAPCPVLTVSRPPTERPAGAFRRILCPLDLADSSAHTAQYAFSLAEEADAEVILLNVLEAHLDRAARAPFGIDLAGYRADVERFAREDLRKLVPPGAKAWCRPEQHVRWGRAHREILALAGGRDVDLIVMGAHGSAIQQAVFGSTAQHVVRAAGCPVLTVRPHARHRDRAPREMAGAGRFE